MGIVGVDVQLLFQDHADPPDGRVRWWGKMLFWVNKRIYFLFTKSKHLGNNRFLHITSGLIDHAIGGYSEIILTHGAVLKIWLEPKTIYS